MSRDVSKSWAMYHEAVRYLAQGSSTSSKAPTLEEVEPAQLVRGEGCRVWDVDGNEYIDFRNSLGPVTLGYAVPEINTAIVDQLGKGIVFGHPHVLEGEVAKLLVEALPCERVRFLKTGGEAIAACIKIARHATRRNKVLHCGYNGWLNNLSAGGYRPAGIAASEPLNGVPPALAALHHTLPWGDIEPWRQAFAEDGEDIAAAVVACDYGAMEQGAAFLPSLRKLTEEHGVLLIMDEIVTGFRLAISGAQEYFGFTADMAVYGKGVANGMPLSVYAGRGDLIDSAKALGISSTFGGETLSLAAAKACMAFYREHQVIDYLWGTAGPLWAEVNRMFEDNDIPARLRGLDVCPLLEAEGDWATRFLAACYQNGVSFYHVPYVNYAHRPADVEETLRRIKQALVEMG
ncbi:MAG TPA: aminotransferase class III-fold pyridoxal phosphate-dependent enzyme [Candidatus Hydrogenedentes bacterium]|nr:aminotransferase class III-fold pyridoxal phosphate-dependent enzyme [Candidatus Hydrogenedentota bacterium]